MAQMEGLYMGLGIDTSQLHSDFVDAEKTINQNLARINNEMKLIKIKGQVELEGLDESASSAEKLRVQEEALTAQLGLQKDKLILLGATYEHLIQTHGESAEVTRQVEYQLTREQLAAQKLEKQLENLSKQEEIAIGLNLEWLGLMEPAWKAIDMAIAAGRTLPIPVPHAKAAAAAAIGLVALADGTIEATEELREENPAKILDESFKQAATSIDDSWQRISESTQLGTEAIQANIERTSELKIFPDFNEVDFIRIVKVLENYRPSEAIVNAIELFSQSDSVIGKLSATLLGLGYTTATIGQPFIENSQIAIDSFRELTKASRELNLSLDKTSDLTSKIDLAGGDYDDVRDYVRGVQDAVIKGDSEDPEVIALEKYGVVIQDTNGKLLAFDETLERLYQGYLKAREAGEAEAYVMMTNGQALHDVLPYFEGVAKAEEDMAKIKWATLDYATLEELRDQMKLVDVQTEELKKSLSSLAAPAANIFLEDTLDFLKTLTDLIEENREEIIYWSFVFVEAVKSLQNFAKELGGEAKDKIIEFYEAFKELKDFDLTSKIKSFFIPDIVIQITEFCGLLRDLEKEFEIISKVESILPDELTSVLETAKKNVIGVSEALEAFGEKIEGANTLEFLKENLKSFIPNELLSGLEMAKDYVVAFSESLKEYEEEIETIRQATNYFLPSISKLGISLGELLFKITNKEKSFLQDGLFSGLGSSIFDPLFNRAQERLEEFKKANEEARKEIERKADESAGLSYSENRIAKYKAELEKLKFDMQYGKDFSYEKALAQNKLWYDEAMKDAKQYAKEKAIIEELNAAKLEQIEQERANKLREIRASVTSEDKSALQQKLDSIEKERQAWLKAGMDEAESVELSQKKIARAYEEAAQKAQEHWRTAADIQYEMTHTAFEKELRDIELWKDAQQEKADTAEEVAGIIAESAAKEAQAFEREVDRIKGKVQTLEDKIFEQEHSRYENDLRKLAQERYQLYQEGIYQPELIERYYQNALAELKSRATKGGDYTKSPTNEGKQRGGNGIVVIGGDQIIDDGLIQSRQAEIGLMTDENQIRAQLSANLSDQAREVVRAKQALQNFSAAQNNLPPAEKSQSSYQVIEGDKVVAMPEISTAPLQEFNSALQQTSTQIDQFALPEISTTPLQNFPQTIEQVSSQIQQIASAGSIFSEKMKQMEQTLPAEYFRNIADGAQGVSQMQMRLTDSTMKLIDAQENLRSVLSNLPSKETQMQTNFPTNGLRQLSTSTQDFVNAQEALLSRKQREWEPPLEPQRNQSKGLNFGFDMDTAGTILGLGALLAGIGGAPITAPIAAGITALSALGGLAKGTYDNTTAPNAQLEKVSELPDLTQIITPLTSIDGNVQSVLQDLQSRQEATISFETIVTPLNNIADIVSNILSAIGNVKQPDITVSPDIKVDLGGAYVFDEKMKSTLVDDITDKIVTAITEAVKSATGNRNYSYSF